MDLLPSEREDGGLQSVFTSVFPIQTPRGLSQLDFVGLSHRELGAQVRGQPEGAAPPARTAGIAAASVVTDPYKTGDVPVPHAVRSIKTRPRFCEKCGDPVGMQLKYDVNESAVNGWDLRRALKVTIRLTI